VGSPPEITPEGRYVAFSSSGTNLVPGVATTSEVYVRDLVGGTTLWASSGASAALQAAFGLTNAVSFNFALSADGQFVAYEASSPSASADLILRYGLVSDWTDLVHTNVVAAPPGANRRLDMTPDGRFIAFVANTNGVSSTSTCILVWDAQTGLATLASGDLSNQVPTNSVCLWPTLDSTGRFVVFLSSASNLVTNSLVGDYHLYLRDTQAATTTLVDADTNGVGTLLTTMPMPSLSADGRFVAFECPDGNLLPRDCNSSFDVFVRDMAAGTNELISVRTSALPWPLPDAPSTLFASAVSSDGRYVALASDADNLVDADTNGCRDVFVRDLVLGTNLLVSVSTNNTAPGDNLSTEPSLSADGRYVVFTSSADNLVAGDTNKASDVFLRDLQAGTTALVSVNSSGTGPGNSASYSPLISTNGRYVLFRSKATNLAPGSFSGENLFQRDLQSATTRALTTNGVLPAASMTPDGRYVAFVSLLVYPGLYIWDARTATRIYANTTISSTPISLSPDARRLFYTTPTGLYVADRVANTNGQITANHLAGRPGMRFSADGRFLAYAAYAGYANTSNQVYLFDFQTGTNLLVSRSYNSTGGANGNSDSPDISADGRFVAYRSDATDIAPGDTNGLPNIFLYDQQTGVTTLLSASRFGNRGADNRSRAPVFSANGQTLVFESWASDLVSQACSFNGNILAYTLSSSSPIVLLQAAIVPDSQDQWLTWPALPGKTYIVQFKNSLNELQWQTLNGAVTVVGGTGYIKDLSPAPTQRFYRIAAY
jgi:Tol biopolymer transport system component